MPTLDEIDRIMTYCEEQQMFTSCLYHAPTDKVRHRAQRPGQVIWIMEDGKPVDYAQKERDE
jgi:hypothetical protein